MTLARRLVAEALGSAFLLAASGTEEERLQTFGRVRDEILGRMMVCPEEGHRARAGGGG